MRALLAMGLLIVLCAAADAAAARDSRMRPPRDPAAGRPGADMHPRARFAVPGWSDEATQRWLNNASSNVGRGG
ncbi:hypothetical protein XH79_06345 [Bradyrhizobium sp. CCBAU 45389]|nr:hypothetical protein [Bradyrhizobium sp. CCBAU 45389]